MMVRTRVSSGVMLAATLLATAAIAATVSAARSEMIALSATQLEQISAAGVTDQQGIIWYNDSDFRLIWRQWRKWQLRLARAHRRDRPGLVAQARIEKMLDGSHGMAIAQAHAHGATTWATVDVSLSAGSGHASSSSSSTSLR